MNAQRLLGVSLILGALAIAGASIATPPPAAGEDKKTVTPEPVTADPALKALGQAAFVKVAKVLQSPRCMNCHPVGNKPLQGDDSHPHKMNISRASVEAGLACSTCHREKNSEELGAPVGSPPGAPHWSLPPKETPMIFEGHTPRSLCEQLRDPAQNGNKTLAQLLHHVSHDPLVLWGWNPGKGRTRPPMSHKDFVAAMKSWVDAGGPCPD